MRVCFIGTGDAGSWAIRGIQIAGTNPLWVAKQAGAITPSDFNRYDLFCVVKHFHHSLARQIRKAQKKIVYDVVDSWRQPNDGLRLKTHDQIVSFYKKRLAGLPIDGAIFANRTMQNDLGTFVPKPITIYHHHKPWIKPITVRERAVAVGYEGCPDYLGNWLDKIQEICVKLGLRFVLNPRDFNEVDIGFATRGGRHGSLIASRYKSNVKLANFYAAGLPCVVHHNEISYRETDNGRVLYFKTEEDLLQRIKQLMPYQTRLSISRTFIDFSRNFSIEKIAERYTKYFDSIIAQPSSNPSG